MSAGSNSIIQRVQPTLEVQITTDQIARRYNGGGDPRYANTLDYALDLLPK